MSRTGVGWNPFYTLLLLTASFGASTPKLVSGTFRSHLQSWQFLTRFCFKSGAGGNSNSLARRLTYDIEFEPGACCPSLNFYYDSPQQWASVYQSELSCEEKVEWAMHSIPLNLSSSGGKCVNTSENLYKCQGVRYIDGSRARWWYITLSNCGGPRVYTLNYTIVMTNGDHFQNKHFSADELGIMETTFITTIISIFIFCATLLYSHLLRKRRLYHSTFKTFQISVFFYMLQGVVGTIYYCNYGVHGSSPRSFWVASRLLEVVSSSCFLGLLLVLANGYTIVAASLTICGFGALLTFTGFFSLLMLSCLIWEENIFDPATVLYTYQSPPGYLLTAIYLPAWVYFIGNCANTGYKFQRKRKFYLALGLFYSGWLLLLPLLIFSANSVIPDWLRRKTVVIAQQVVWISSYFYLLVIFTPTHANKHFPFHLRVTKVDLGSEVQDNNYSPHVPREKREAEEAGAAAVDIFTVT